MEATRGEAGRRALVLLGVLAAILATGRPAVAKTHTVGGKEGWDTSADLKTWASSNTFRVGDKLVFEYTAQLHNVVEIPDEERYKSCNLNGLPDDMSGGKNTVKLDKPGTRYFACGHPGHCEQGMKVKIKTLSAKEAAAPSEDTPSSSSTTPSSKDKPSSSTAGSKDAPSSSTTTASSKSSSWSLMGSSAHVPLVAVGVLWPTLLGLVMF